MKGSEERRWKNNIEGQNRFKLENNQEREWRNMIKRKKIEEKGRGENKVREMEMRKEE